MLTNEDYANVIAIKRIKKQAFNQWEDLADFKLYMNGTRLWVAVIHKDGGRLDVWLRDGYGSEPYMIMIKETLEDYVAKNTVMYSRKSYRDITAFLKAKGKDGDLTHKVNEILALV